MSDADSDLDGRFVTKGGPQTSRSSRAKVPPPAPVPIRRVSGSLIPVRSSGNQSRLVTSLPVFSAPKTANTVKSFQELRESLEIPIETILLLPAVSNRS
ncbi:hypothetical protein IGI04_006055 [Brassica rapa subsp. trilocularis]|uniref:Uncharacterized protein n=1 Tax=Brassica rapa subsp. trilocularis TaxID=1813537 RepID=A0ABQ7NH69_BRACM|nr:hypothetical protein IGI04_006055 [Brassica rapa subsp. trilocularis]